MNRRSILKALGLAAMPSTGVSVSRLGSTLLPMSDYEEPYESDVCETMPGDYFNFWETDLSKKLEARKEARYYQAKGYLYPHMKSWGHAFRLAQAEEELYLQKILEKRLQNNRTLFEKLFGDTQ